MENDLLSHEVRFLKHRVSELQRQVAEGEIAHRELLATRLGASVAEVATMRAQLASAGAGVERLKIVENDLLWLLGRLRTNPIGLLLRMRRGYRTLERSYLDAPASDVPEA